MHEGQRELDTGQRRRTVKQTNLADFEGVFPVGVFPTEARIIHNNGHILVYHQYGYMESVPGAQRRMWKALAQYGIGPDAPGSITVICVWGNVNTAARLMARWDWTGEHEQKLHNTDSIKAALSKWWSDTRK